MRETPPCDVVVQVDPAYLPDHSNPVAKRWLFSYTVIIRNQGSAPVRLLARTWRITDATGHTEVVEGPGVVGEQPEIAPGGSFTYTSYCPLKTSLGGMEGSYTMETATGEMFEAPIAPFTLADPQGLH